MQAEDAVLHAEVERCRSVLVGAPSSVRHEDSRRPISLPLGSKLIADWLAVPHR